MAKKKKEGAFCQTYVPFSVDTATVPASTNKRARSQGLISEFSSKDLCALPRERRLRGLTVGKKDRSGFCHGTSFWNTKFLYNYWRTVAWPQSGVVVLDVAGLLPLRCSAFYPYRRC